MKKKFKSILSMIMALIMVVSIFPVVGIQPNASAVSGSEIVAYARQFIGCAYVSKASGPSSFDCSGFTMYVFGHFGISLPHSTQTMWNNPTAYGTVVGTGSTANAQAGDLILWYEHVAIDTENGKCVEALNSKYGVTEAVSVNSHTNGTNYKVIRVYGVNSAPPTVPTVYLSKTTLAVNETATLSWSNCSEASYYWISCWSSTEQCISEEGLNYSKQVSFSKPGKYSITVVSGNSSGETVGNWIEINVYNDKPSTPNVELSESSIQSGENIIVSWGLCNNATSYNIDIWSENNHIDTLYVGTNLSYSVKLLSAGTYKIYVSAINFLGGSTSEPKELKVFNVPQKPIIKSILSNADGTVTLKWTQCSNANKYSIRFFEIGQTTEYVFLNRVTSDTEYTYALPDGIYTALITAENPVSHTNGDMSKSFNIKKTYYEVIFNSNGGTCSTSSKTVTYNSTYGTLPTPTRTGYTFDGWYTSSTGGTKITADTKVTITANQTLYAHWTLNHKHSYTSKITKQPSCTATGVKTFTCSCGDTYTETISALGHDYGEWKVTKPATTSATDVETRYCSRCTAYETRTIPKLTDQTVELNNHNITMNYKATTQLVASNKNVEWTSSNINVATVDSNGKVTAAGTGNAVIKATIKGTNISDSCQISVSYAWWQWIIEIFLLGFLWY